MKTMKPSREACVYRPCVWKLGGVADGWDEREGRSLLDD